MSAPPNAEVLSSLRPAGPVAAVTHEMTWVLTIGATLVFLVVVAALAAALWRSRRRHREGTMPSSATGDRRLTRWWIGGAGIAFPLAVLLPLLVYATLRTEALTPGHAEPPGGELVVTVKGRLWWWEVTYRDPVRGIAVVGANQIDLPVGRPVTLALVSDDVIHSFWVPPLAGKVDLVPGRIHHLRVQADRPGVYRGACAEFCGEQHARMAIHVVAQPAEAFDRWLVEQARPAAPPVAEAARGLAVFEQRRCAACHTVRGLGAESRIGPDLTHLASRLHVGAGTLPLSRASLAAWVADPQQVKPGTRMPSYRDLDAASLDALVSFLETLR